MANRRPCRCDRVPACHVCTLYHKDERYRKLWDRDDPGGPGTELKAMLLALGIQSMASCRCQEMAQRMDDLGVQGCREHRAELVEYLRQQVPALATHELALAAIRAVWSGLAIHLSLTDPVGSLLDEAIRRAANAASGAPPRRT